MGLFSKKKNDPGLQQTSGQSSQEGHLFHVHNGGNGQGDFWITETEIRDALGKKTYLLMI